VRRNFPIGPRILALVQFGGALVIFLSTIGSKVSYTDSDALGALLLSKALSIEGTFQLDSMVQRGVSISDWALSQNGGHSYYYFPIGSSLLAIPLFSCSICLGLIVQPMIMPFRCGWRLCVGLAFFHHESNCRILHSPLPSGLCLSAVLGIHIPLQHIRDGLLVS